MLDNILENILEQVKSSNLDIIVVMFVIEIVDRIHNDFSDGEIVKSFQIDSAVSSDHDHLSICWQFCLLHATMYDEIADDMWRRVVR